VSNRPTGHDFYVGGQRVAANVPDTFLPHIIAEHTGMSAAQAADARARMDLAGLVIATQQFVANDVLDIENGHATLAEMRSHFDAQKKNPDRNTEIDGETTFDLWERLPPEGRRDLLLTAAWAARDGELPDVEPGMVNIMYAVSLHEFARAFTGTMDEFLPKMPGDPLRHPAAVFASSYAFDRDEEPLDVLTTFLILNLGALNATRAEQAKNSPQTS
jgi:hypothetical protein